MPKIEVTLVRSTSGRPDTQVRIVRSLGLRHIRQTVMHPDNPCIRGMVGKVRHLVTSRVVEDK